MNNLIKKAQENFNILDNLFKSFQQFDNVEATEYRRKELSGLIKKHVNDGTLERKDEKGEIKLWTGTRSQFGMAEDISIRLVKGKFSLCLDGLEGSVFGAYEHLNELKS